MKWSTSAHYSNLHGLIRNEGGHACGQDPITNSDWCTVRVLKKALGAFSIVEILYATNLAKELDQIAFRVVSLLENSEAPAILGWGLSLIRIAIRPGVVLQVEFVWSSVS